MCSCSNNYATLPDKNETSSRENFVDRNIYRKSDSPQSHVSLLPPSKCPNECRSCPNSHWGNRIISNYPNEIAQTSNQNPIIGTNPFYKLGPQSNTCQFPWYPYTIGYRGSCPPPPQINPRYYPWYTLEGGRY